MPGSKNRLNCNYFEFGTTFNMFKLACQAKMRKYLWLSVLRNIRIDTHVRELKPQWLIRFLSHIKFLKLYNGQLPNRYILYKQL